MGQRQFARCASGLRTGLSMADVMGQLMAAMNRHDPHGVAGVFAADYRSEQPLHPHRGFGGSKQVLANWTSVFEGVPDFHADLIASTYNDGVLWAEQRWTGTYLDGSP